MSESQTPSTNCLPEWGQADLPNPPESNMRSWMGLVGPGLVMCGIQLAGGEWLLGSEITARYGGDLMWVAGLAILFQVFYNLECGRYAVFCGEPIMTGFMRKVPGPKFWIGFVLLLNMSAIIPGLSTQGAAALAALVLDRPPDESDRGLVTVLAFILLGAISLPILVGGKIYNMLQWVMTTKVVVVLTFCILVGVTLVRPANWWDVFSGFVKIGSVPVVRGEDVNGNGKLDDGEDFDMDGNLDQVETIRRVDSYGKVVEFDDLDGDGKWDGENVENLFLAWYQKGEFPSVLLTQIALLGAFAGYAGGGGLANATYSNFVRDKGWGMGWHVGAIASAVGGRRITLSHLGKTFPLTRENLERWRGWWRHLIKDQLVIWGPGCVMGMALPALLSLQFAQYSPIYSQAKRLDWSQAIIAADGMRNASDLGIWLPKILWWSALCVGLLVLLPSQMSIVDDFSRRWTDAIWSGSRRVRERWKDDQVKWIYYTILSAYVTWTFIAAYLFGKYGTPKLATLIIANLNNVALGATSFQVLWVNRTLLPRQLRPGFVQQCGLVGCGVFYLGMALLVFVTKQVPLFWEWWNQFWR